MQSKLSREFLETELSKIPRNKYNCFQWWRRYQTRDTLPKKAPLYDKIVNGDYDHSSYLYQLEMELYLMNDKIQETAHPDEAHEIRSLFMERYRRLSIDYEKEESRVMQELKSDFVKTFKIDKKSLEEIMETFDGTLIELYNHIKNKMYGNNRINCQVH